MASQDQFTISLLVDVSSRVQRYMQNDTQRITLHEGFLLILPLKALLAAMCPGTAELLGK